MVIIMPDDVYKKQKQKSCERHVYKKEEKYRSKKVFASWQDTIFLHVYSSQNEGST